MRDAPPSRPPAQATLTPSERRPKCVGEDTLHSSGFSSGILGVAVSQGVFYYAYESIRELYASAADGTKHKFTDLENLLIGTVAGRQATSLWRAWCG